MSTPMPAREGKFFNWQFAIFLCVYYKLDVAVTRTSVYSLSRSTFLLNLFSSEVAIAYAIFRSPAQQKSKSRLATSRKFRFLLIKI